MPARLPALFATLALLLPTAPAAAEPAGPGGTVVSGQARFQVLSPTLVRTEYAGDRRFVDARTFNAIGRDAFPRTAYRSRVVDDWLVITTSALTLRYRVGSGPFRADNLELRVNGITASPWRRVVCDTGQLCEAEDQEREGLAYTAEHPGHTGTGFAAAFALPHHGITATVRAGTGPHRLVLRYANGRGGDGKHESRALTLTTDGGSPRRITLPPTDSWSSWQLAETPVDLPPGEHRLALTRTAEDSGNINLDSLALLTANQPYPANRAQDPCPVGMNCEAEGGTTTAATEHPGHSGIGFAANAPVARQVTVPTAGTYAVHIRYANARGGDGKHEPRTVLLNNRPTPLPTTDSWSTWRTETAQLALPAGTSTLALTCPPEGCHVNVDTISVTTPTAAPPAPHLPLGGYRRGLDGFDGERGAPQLNPGLLHRDGWYLLDDTPSALYDQPTPTARPLRGAHAYQDGYVFGYGQDFKAALGDLSRLTGPPKLLPRWAYGVWYSEYIDRTAADFRDRVIPAFREHGVPLDVLVVDTDFKGHNAWNGWRVDKAKFPDPEGFLKWAKDEGLATTLNIHPSILATDPDFPKAQATAKGKLAKSPGCNRDGADCHIFDWADPDQLRAYLDLHRGMAKPDFWWLDWCCDSSLSTLRGVTPDAWINEIYAKERNFAFSRAFGSLQAGGYSGAQPVPTGPWSEKRNTLHFTGDTSSTWGTMKATIGYTSAEGVSTGMSAISHDIGGHNDTTGIQGSETYLENGRLRYTTKLPDDLYARWVQLGAFQPITRLHSNHGDRLPWQYGPEAKASATKFLNLRERLVPYLYTLAEQTHRTGIPMVRPLYLDHPANPESYSTVDTQFLLGQDLLVVPVTTPGPKATTEVWFPPGEWTDYFTGRTYQGNTRATIESTLDTMPVFLRKGGVLVERTTNVANDAKHPADALTVHATAGATADFTLFEDNTRTRITQSGNSLTVHPGAAERAWTVKLHNTDRPTEVKLNGQPTTWHWDAATRTLTADATTQGATLTYR
ncbi:hypothetical protein JOF53_007480 [Crossiella equi]|uniref:CBM6 domain-containing protein n=1 Tax=Crossiella equi TaxID=130796 RepID=A0ABS5APX2_9PSEU|nr:TIM-barrel domain-containing protein [Crossiella equi]MBP2478608.1 hypothetical protein [Crossiella equi]